MTCLGPTMIDPIGAKLGTGYLRFASPVGIHGLAKVTGKSLELLAVDALRPGNGHFTAFLNLCKLECDKIFVWHVTSEILHDCLPRHGFRPWQERQLCQGEWEHLEGYRWDK